MQKGVCKIPIEKKGVFDHYLELDLKLLEIIFVRSDLATMVALHGVCKELRVAVNSFFIKRSDGIISFLQDFQTCSHRHCKCHLRTNMYNRILKKLTK